MYGTKMFITFKKLLESQAKFTCFSKNETSNSKEIN